MSTASTCGRHFHFVSLPPEISFFFSGGFLAGCCVWLLCETEKTPREGRKERILRRTGKKSAKFWAPPPFSPTLCCWLCGFGRQGFTQQPKNSKREHLTATALPNTTKIQREDPQRDKKSENGNGRWKTAKIWAPPFRAMNTHQILIPEKSEKSAKFQATLRPRVVFYLGQSHSGFEGWSQVRLGPNFCCCNVLCVPKFQTVNPQTRTTKTPGPKL